MIWKDHILRLALPPLITVVALQVAFLLSGTVVTEAVFARPGLGSLLLNATLQRDYPVVQSIACFAAVLYVIVIFIADVIHAVLDPRIHS
ncbi:ABC transporter permease [bacterium]|nr:ABC transporter permease [bacterium]